MIEFDEAKRRINLAKHGVDFLIAGEFDWQTAIVREDGRFDYGETRLNALGFIGADLYAMAFTMREERVRVISLRHASKKERTLYEQAKGQGPA